MSIKSPPKVLQEYAKNRGVKITTFLGVGSDGVVWKSDQHSAIKALYDRKRFDAEISCYQHLTDQQIRSVCGLIVPRVYGSDSTFLVLEIEMVSPPCLIDFGKAFVDEYAAEFDDLTSEFPEETLREHENMQRELWGGHYDRVQAVLWQLKQYGIVYRDPRPANIMFADWEYGDRPLS